MTVSTTDNVEVYRGNGSATNFAVGFKVLDEDHLLVRRRVYATSVFEHTYVGTDYSYSGIGDDSGTLSLSGTPLDDDYEIVIERIVPYTQDLDLVNSGGFYPETVEEQLDRIVMGMQQLDNESDRALKLPHGETAGLLPSIVDLEGKVISVADGEFIAAENDAAGASAERVLAQAARVAAEAAATLPISTAADAVARAARASALLLDEVNFTETGADLITGYTQGFGFTAETTATAQVKVIDTGTPANDFEGTIDAFTPALTYPVRNIVNQAGATVASVLGTPPIDWSDGFPALHITAADNFEILLNRFPAGRTFAFQFAYVPGAVGASVVDFLTISKTDASEYCTFTIEDANTADARLLFTVRQGGVNYSQRLGRISDLAEDGKSLSIVFVIVPASGGVSARVRISVNGIACYTDPQLTGIPTLNKIVMGAANVVLRLRRMAVLPDILGATAAANFLNGARYHSLLITSFTMAEESSTTTTDRERMPYGVYLGTVGNVAHLLGFHHQRDSDGGGGNPEGPLQIMQQRIDFDGTTFSSPTARSAASWTPTGWSTGAAGAWIASPMTGVVPSGTNKGTLVQVAEKLIGAAPGGDQDFIARRSVNHGQSYTDEHTIIDGSAQTYAANPAANGFPVYSGASGHMLFFPTDHTLSGTAAFPFYVGTSGVCIAYSTNPGEAASTWSHTNLLGGWVTYEATESAIALMPNGQVRMVIRREKSSGDLASFATWDGTANGLVSGGDIPSFEGVNTNMSLVQLDPEGALGPYGCLMLIRAGRNSANNSREGILATLHETADMTPYDATWLLPRWMKFSYCNAVLVEVRGVKYLILFVENYVGTFNSFAGSHVMAFRLPERGLRA